MGGLPEGPQQERWNVDLEELDRLLSAVEQCEQRIKASPSTETEEFDAALTDYSVASYRQAEWLRNNAEAMRDRIRELELQVELRQQQIDSLMCPHGLLNCGACA